MNNSGLLSETRLISLIFQTKTARSMTSATTESYLAGSASFSTVPATVTPTVAYERGAATQQDVEDDPETPEITSLVIERGFISEDLHNLWSHVFS